MLEAWNRLEGIEPASAYVPLTVREQPAEPDPPVVADVPVAISPRPPLETQQVVMEEPSRNETQPGLIDFSVYRCLSCDKMIMGYEREVHLRRGA